MITMDRTILSQWVHLKKVIIRRRLESVFSIRLRYTEASHLKLHAFPPSPPVEAVIKAAIVTANCCRLIFGIGDVTTRCSPAGDITWQEKKKSSV